MRSPILVTGSHRSGTTWLGQMLSLSNEAFVVHEPFNPSNARTWFHRPPPRWFLAVDPDRPAPWDAEMRRVLTLRPPVDEC